MPPSTLIRQVTRNKAFIPYPIEINRLGKAFTDVTDEIATIVQSNSDIRHKYHISVLKRDLFNKMLIDINSNHQASGANLFSEDAGEHIEYALFYRRKHQEEVEQRQAVTENLDKEFRENIDKRQGIVYDLVGFNFQATQVDVLMRAAADDDDTIRGMMADMDGVDLAGGPLRCGLDSSRPDDPIPPYTRQQRNAFAKGLEGMQAQTMRWLALLQSRGYQGNGGIIQFMAVLLGKDKKEFEIVDMDGEQKSPEEAMEVEYSMERLIDIYVRLEKEEVKLWRVSCRYYKQEGDDVDPKNHVRPRNWKSIINVKEMVGV